MLGNVVVLTYMIVIEAPVAIVGLSSPPIFQLVQRIRHHGFSGLFYTDPPTYGSKSGMSAERSKAENFRPASRASSDPNNGLVQNGAMELHERTSADEVALNSILQGKNISAEEEQHKSRQSPDPSRHFTPNLKGTVSNDSIV